MNTIYRIVWNATTCRWVVASEMAKGRKKSSAKGIASKLAAIGMMAAVAPVFALSTNGKAPLIVNDMSFNQTDGGNCQAIGGDGTNTFVNIPNCDANSMTSGNYKNARQTDSVVVAANGLSVGGYQYINGADGSNALTITQSGANILMNAGKITGLANGTAATDSVNVSQLTPLVSALGAGAAFNAGTGVVTGPSYSLANANSIAGTSGAATDVGSAFNTVDTALGKLNTSITNINNGAGIKYFHTNSVQSDSSATGGEAIAIGGSATASGGSAVAIGQNASSGGSASIAIGQNASIASGINNSLSIGGGSQSGNQSTSLGNSADTHLSSYAVAIGHATSVTGASGTALGAGAVASTTNSVALGANSTTTANLATSGYNPGTAALSGTASAANGEVSLGSAGKERRLTNVAAGANATDAVNVSQLQSEDAKVNNVASTTASALGTTVGANGAINAPSYTLANANSIGGTAGAATTVSSGFSKVDTALGTLNTAVTTAQTTANTANTTANKGWNLSADAGATSQNIAPGGTANFAAGTNATVARSGNTITVGVVSNPTFSGMLTANGGLTVGAGQTASMGGNKVTNVANGTLSAASTDAVNGSQLYATNQQVAQNTSDIAGNTTSISNITNQINNGTVGLVQQAAAGADLTVGKSTDGAAVNFADKNGNSRTLKNVTAGVAATDAVNMSQLNATNANVAGNTTAITNLGNRVTTNEGSISTINTTIAGMNGQLADAVKYDSAAHDTVTLGNAGTPVQVTNVKNGALSAASSDAVNGSQLYATNQQVAQNTTDIAGNTTAIAGNTTSINNITNQINSGTVGLVQQAAAGADLTVGKGTDGVAVDFADKNGATRTLKNVTAGVADTDAVNMSQLNTTNANVTRVEGKADQQGTTTASAFGGGASYNSTTGAISAPSYTLHNADGTTTTASDVGTAVTNIDGRVVQNTSDINTINTQINSGTIGLVQQASAGANLTVGKSTDGAAVDFQGTAGPRKLLNVADGTVAAGSKDAVNGGQLYGVSQSMADAIGGGSTVNADGSISAPSYSVHNANGSTTTVNNVGSAITNLDGRVSQNTTDISTINTTITGMNGQLADAVKYDSAAHDKVTLGNAGTPVQVSNVKDSALSATSSDAVNGSQLYATNQQVAQNTGDIANINSTINTMNTGGLKYVQVNSTAAAANAAGSDSVAVGGNTKASAANAVAIGNGAQASQANSVALGAGSVADRANSVSVGAVGQERQVTNVAAGNLSASSTDAVNGSQLNATNQAVTNLDGRVTNVENTVNTMAGAVSNVTNITNGQSGMFQVSKDSNSKQPVASGSTSTAGGNGAVASGNNSTALGNAAVASADNSVAVGANSVADRSNSVSMGSAGHERQVTNVAAGTANTDAVNVGQLKAAGVMNADGSTNTAVTYDTNADGSSSVTLNGGGNAAVIHNVAPGTSATDAATVGQVQQVADWSKSYTDQQVRNMGRQADGGVASAMAMSSIPQAVVNGGHSIGAGVGSFRGQSSVAVSMSAMSATGKFAVKLNVSATTHGDAGVGVGASYNW